MLLVLDTGIRYARSPKARLMASVSTLSLIDRAGTVGVDVVDVLGRHLGVRPAPAECYWRPSGLPDPGR